jgi:cellulose synthase operon protein C
VSIVHCRIAVYALLLACGSAQAFVVDYDPARPAVFKPCDEHRYRGREEAAQECYSEAFSATRDNSARALAAWGLGDLSAANVLFRAAAQVQPKSAAARVGWGRLFIVTHQDDDAVKLFKEALALEPGNAQAMLGLAQVYAGRFDGNARNFLNQALAADDTLIEAHLLLARMNLDEGQLDEVDKPLERAQLLLDRTQLPPLDLYALRAALEAVRGGDGTKWAARALAYNPHFGGVYEAMAYFEVTRRRYAEAVVLLRRALQLQPDSASAHAALGENLLRLGLIEAGQKELAAAYEGDPYSVTTVNSLRLLDRFSEFENIAVNEPNRATQLRLHKKEAAVLRPYVQELTQSAIDTFAKRYRFTPKQPITVELYPNHDDFAVRVGGLPGIGLLGVTFGYLLAMDSPSGRATGDFHWGSTLWHEMAHVFTLEATEHRVPRWLSEGISVFEEWRTGPTPGVVVTLDAVTAFSEGKFLKIEDLDGGFIRPRYQGQIQVSYMQAGLVCFFIEQQFGFDKLVALLEQFKRDAAVGAAVRASLGISADDFDKRFNEFVAQRYAKVLPHMDEWKKHMAAATQAADRSDWSAVIEPARKAVAMYPEYLVGDSGYLLLAKAYEETKQPAQALAILQDYRKAGGWDPDALRQLAKLLQDNGRTAQAIEVWHALNYGDPMQPQSHLLLADALLAGKQSQGALREYRALLALGVIDEAPAYLGVAKALADLGDRAGSRRNLLQALEAAPNFRPAQEMLLQSVGKSE